MSTWIKVFFFCVNITWLHKSSHTHHRICAMLHPLSFVEIILSVMWAGKRESRHIELKVKYWLLNDIFTEKGLSFDNSLGSKTIWNVLFKISISFIFFSLFFLIWCLRCKMAIIAALMQASLTPAVLTNVPIWLLQNAHLSWFGMVPLCPAEPQDSDGGWWCLGTFMHSTSILGWA